MDKTDRLTQALYGAHKRPPKGGDKYNVYFSNEQMTAVAAVTFTEAAIRAVQQYPAWTVTRIVRHKDKRTVETRW